MPRTNALVDGVKEISRPVAAVAAREPMSAQYATVAFGGGRTGLLDLSVHRSRVWAEVLESLRETGAPAYVEVDPNTSLITEVLLPIPFSIGRIERFPDGLQVELIISHARHLLRRSNPNFEELRQTLEEARNTRSSVLITETLDGQEIIDARPAPRRAVPVRGGRRRK